MERHVVVSLMLIMSLMLKYCCKSIHSLPWKSIIVIPALSQLKLCVALLAVQRKSRLHACAPSFMFSLRNEQVRYKFSFGNH